MFEGFADTPEARLWYWDTQGEGHAVILCHPGSQSCRIWEFQKAVFAEAGYRVVAYSRRGHYRSEKGPPGHPGTAVNDLVQLLDFLAIDRAHILGAAAGGIAALAFALEYPDRLTRLVLAGTIFAPEEKDWQEMYSRLAIAEVQGLVSTEFLELGPSYRASNPKGTALFARYEKVSKPQGVFKQPLGTRISWTTLEQMRVPTFLLTGEADLYAPPPLQALVAAHLPNHQCATLREIGHAAYWEDPAAFNALVLDFLTD